ncbi:MAG: response regulator, partial [Algiphilus sp.]
MVDDDAFHRLIITAKLHRLGLRDVWQAASSAEALAITKAQSPDIIFCDIRMEGQDGMDLLAE